MNRKVKIVSVLICAVMLFQLIGLAAAVSGSDTPSYSYDHEWVTGLFGTKYSNANKATGKCECYAYIYALSCDAGAEVFAYQSSTGSYRWHVEAEISLTAYFNNVGIWSGADVRIHIKLLDASKSEVAKIQVFFDHGGPAEHQDISFASTDFDAYFSTYYSTVRYIGVTFFVAVGNGGMVCQDSGHTTVDYPAYIDVSSISWESY